MTLTDPTGRIISLGSPKLGWGGEADVFSVTTDPTVVAKIYHTPSPERAAKLEVMLANPPSDPTAAQGHVSVCWPTALLFDHRRVTVGFLMHRVDFASSVPVFSLYNPQDRQEVAPAFTWEYLLRTAKNIASAVEALHSRGYVVGDLNESNILVANTAMVTLVDCDSMQVPQPRTGMFFRCPVGKAESTPPELQGCEFSRVDRVQAHDNFSLGVLFFQLLMEGTHPFSGVWQAASDPPSIEERIRIGASPYVGASSAMPMPGAPPFKILGSDLQALFESCFRDGHQSPDSRPTPREWLHALAAAETNLRTCPRSRRHIYSAHLTSCPWCDRTRLLGGFDPFPLTPQKRPTKRSDLRTPAPGPQSVVVPKSPLAAAAVSPIWTALPVAPSRAPTPNWTTAIAVSVGVILAALLGFQIFGVVASRNESAAQASVQAAAQAADQARRAEELRIAERQRVEQGIVGEWYFSSGPSRRHKTFTITRSGDTFRAEYPCETYFHDIVLETMRGTILADNQLKLQNVSAGKLRNPATYCEDDLPNDVWIELTGEGSLLIVRFSQAKGGSSLVMNRKSRSLRPRRARQ